MGDGPRNWEDPAETAEWEAAKARPLCSAETCGNYALPGVNVCRLHGGAVPVRPTRPNPSGSSPGAPRWFGWALIAGAAVALGAALLFARSERAERDARVSDLATEACTP
jgi:hypothetical protein